MKRRVCLLLLCLLCSILSGRMTLCAANPNPDNMLGIRIAPCFYKGIGIEYQRHLVGTNWLKIQPSYYFYKNYSSLRKSDIRDLQGFEVGLYHNVDYFRLADKGFKLYFQWGADYSRFLIQNVLGVNSEISRYGLSVALGLKQIIARSFYIDFNIGYGNRWVNNKTDISNVSPDDQESLGFSRNTGEYNRSIFDYGHKGAVFNVELNFGFVF